MRLPFISIIIPVYQVEAFIEECVQSVAQQTYRGSIECIIIDDCGKDKTMDIVNHFLKFYSGPIKFRVIRHERNQGVSAARNTGINAAKGDYLMLIDDDDFITPNCIDTLVECIQKSNSDMACAAFKTIEGYNHWWSDGYQFSDFQSSKNRI